MFISVKCLQETIDQLKEFEASLEKSSSGNMSLVDQIGGVQLAIQSAIRSTTSPDILNMFIQKQGGALRSRLSSLESDKRLGRISSELYETEAVEILKMLEKLKEPLNSSEQEILRRVIIVFNTQKPYVIAFDGFQIPMQHTKNMEGYTDVEKEVGKSTTML